MRIVRDFVVEHLGDPDAVAVLDETGQEKKGTHTAGVKPQYVGCAGQVANAVNIVYCTYASARGHAQAGARLYLPAEIRPAVAAGSGVRDAAVGAGRRTGGVCPCGRSC
jgi:SRSO17 transposase